MPIRLLSPSEALARQRAGALLVDVRGDGERALGMAAGAIGIDREQLQADPARHLADPAAEILLICQLGLRSQLAAQALVACGYRNLASVEGGLQAWQAKLEVARVLLVGAGGLGSPAAFYLAAAGVGHLRIADDDVVDRSNLQRQILHTEARIGLPKVASAAVALSALNPRTSVEAVRERVTAANVERLLDGVDVVIDGADNFPARYLLNDACMKLGQRVRCRSPSRQRAVLPLPVPGAAAAGGRAQLRRGRRARGAAGGDRAAAGHRSDQVAARHRRYPARPPAAVRCAGDAIPRDPAGRRPAVSGLRAGSRIQWICGLRGVLRRELR